MIFELFIFLTLIVLGLIVLGITTRHPMIIVLGSVFMILVGASLMSDGLRDEGAFTLVQDGNTFVMSDYNVLTTTNDPTIGMIAPFYFYGGFLGVLVGLFGVLWAVKQRKGSVF